MRYSIHDLEVLLRVPYVVAYGGFDISPDGAMVAFSWNQTGQWEIYEIPVDLSTAKSGPGTGVRPDHVHSCERVGLRVTPNFDLLVLHPESKVNLLVEQFVILMWQTASY